MPPTHAKATPAKATPAKSTATPRPANERGPRREVLMTEVLDAAAALFASKGYGATSLQDIAEAIGLSRTSLYYYVPSKEALLEELVRGVNVNTASIFATSPAAGHAEQLAEAARQLVIWVTSPHTHFKLVDRAENELPEALAAAHRETKRRVLHDMTRLVQAGIDGGAFRPVDPRVTAFAILGMCNWTAWWFSPSGALDRNAVADQIALLAVGMVQKSPGTGTAGDMKSILGAMRENLDLLDRLAR